MSNLRIFAIIALVLATKPALALTLTNNSGKPIKISWFESATTGKKTTQTLRHQDTTLIIGCKKCEIYVEGYSGQPIKADPSMKVTINPGQMVTYY